MVRLARVVIPHHITQRGDRRQQVFFQDAGNLGTHTNSAAAEGEPRPEGRETAIANYDD
jgi:hypothetical protein